MIYPAVDIRGGRCVRLRQGDPGQATDFGDPLEIAARYKEQGAAFLHVVDLDGAFGTGDNSAVVARITAQTGLPVQVGGGIRSRSRIEEYLGKGIERVVLGTAVVEDPALVAWAAGTYPGRIAAGLDARDGKVAVKGWTAQSGLTVADAARQLAEAGVNIFIYTDIGRDGMMGGPDVAGTRRLAATGAQVIGSGGISGLQDVEALREAGASGCIIGRALLDGAFTLEEAISCGARPC